MSCARSTKIDFQCSARFFVVFRISSWVSEKRPYWTHKRSAHALRPSRCFSLSHWKLTNVSSLELCPNLGTHTHTLAKIDIHSKNNNEQCIPNVMKERVWIETMKQDMKICLLLYCTHKTARVRMCVRPTGKGIFDFFARVKIKVTKKRARASENRNYVC